MDLDGRGAVAGVGIPLLLLHCASMLIVLFGDMWCHSLLKY